MPEIKNHDVFTRAEKIIKTLYGDNAEFRDGQYEAIEAVMTKNRVLVVQRTGWGKSLVYFACTKLLREQRRGVTLVVSPLLILMENQLEAAKRLGLNCDVLNSRVKERREEILGKLVNDKLDLLLITPETLFGNDVQSRLKDVKIGLFVIDEAHCISDWGHDFRLDYGNLINVIRVLPANVPVLATTATANDRVIGDLEKQLGGSVYISRGPLTRHSLSIQVLRMKTKAERYGWILANLNNFKGSGIIYCLTQHDCEYLADFLVKNGISAVAYHSDLSDEQIRKAEELFKCNKIKAIVATVKLGMGYDKGDIAFVIHFQMPANIVAYYQQIGRAGRQLDRAYAVLMCGDEDERIIKYFIDTAFPSESETGQIMQLLFNSNGMKIGSLTAKLNIERRRIEKALTFLVNDGFVIKDRGVYSASPKKYFYDRAHYDEIIRIRRRETEQMKELAKTPQCYSKFIVNCLDDYTAKPCGRCANCSGGEIIPSEVPFEIKQLAAEYINGRTGEIKPRKMWAESSLTKYEKMQYSNRAGIYLAKYGEAGYGELVQRDKYAGKKFCDELLKRSVEVIKPVLKEHGISFITCVPSLRSDIVADLAERIADMCNVTFVQLLQKADTKQQKYMENSSYQCENAYKSFTLIPRSAIPERVLLVDDIVDSGWTLAVCGYRLMEGGCVEVYPFALANSAKGYNL